MKVLEKKYAISILLFLAKNGGATSKRSIQKALGKDRTVFVRIGELSEIGLISCNHSDVKIHNSYTINLTDRSREIADRLVECESYFEMI